VEERKICDEVDNLEKKGNMRGRGRGKIVERRKE
jgi:hypothetical protein